MGLLQDAGGLRQGACTRCSECSLLPVSHAARSVSWFCLLTDSGGLRGSIGTEKNPHFVEEVAAFCGKDDVFVVACNTGNRSRFATADLLNAGFKNVRNLQGGYRSFLQSANQQRPQQQ
ncbi:thiosulfate sulfurtransferase 16, chloroplastic-like isoform X3 [Miscanthus floridulus]|uniref:thiosulfate sulfurtransferase 16, chloroplastic-like isoform X3 n=1 Tax=Miscanthus floridulus TaxID=154761 RepID=UPI00345999A7